MPPSADIQTIFLGADRPALPAAAAWLVDAFADAGADLGKALVVVPGSRAQRRLMELLAERSEGRALEPPTIVTIGKLADRLMPPAVEHAAASRLDSLLAWSSVLREADPALLSLIVPNAPARDDWPGWWSLAEQVVQAAGELGAQLLLVQDVVDRLTEAADVERWQALAELDVRYHALLAERGRIDQHLARRRAIEEGTCEYGGAIVLVATADLQPVHERMLRGVNAPVYALVFADQRDAGGFDTHGGLITSYWNNRQLAIEDEAIRFVDRPGDQSAAVLDVIAQWNQAQPTAADDITVGLGDTALSGPVARVLELAGLPVRSATPRSVSQARPVMLLRALSEFAQGLRFDKLAALLRHPDAELHISRVAGEATQPWLTLLDRYATDHLAQRPTAGWLGDEAQVRAMDAVYRAARSLLPEPIHALRPLHDWPKAIAAALAEVYGGRSLHRYGKDDRPVVAALEAIGSVLTRLSAIDPAVAPHCTCAQAITLTLSMLTEQAIPEPGGEPAIELVGYLELLLDDAPRLVIAGMNEHHVPEPTRTSALLPEGARRGLGLPGDAQRLARDGYALQAMIASRAPGGVRCIAGRRSQDGDPLLPSRLLLKEGDGTLVRRISEFVAEQGESRQPPPMLITPGKHDRFLIPRPVLPPEPITKLRATAFRDYLACPYRFYLKHVLRLETFGDEVLEVSASEFGTLAHDALCVLARPDMIGMDDAQAIADRLSMSLDDRFQRAYGADPPVAARVQVEQLRYRLSVLAHRHAEMIAEGWRIVHHEQKLKTDIIVDDQPFTITGQIDRIDRHINGQWRVIDYKTSDSGKEPEQTHRRNVDGVKQWVDLQLPLYLDLAARLGVEGSAEVGYINLPKKPSEVRFEPAPWNDDDLRLARQQRDEVIRRIRAGIFWPPGNTSDFDGLAALCGDAVADRMALIKASTSRLPEEDER